MTDTAKNTILAPEKFTQHADRSMDELVEEIIKLIEEHTPNANTDPVVKAYNLAKSKHEGQVRKSGEPYITHPVNVAYIAAQLSLDVSTITACLLHDIIEDTDCTSQDIKEEFGEVVAELVDGVTKLKKIQ